VSISQTLLPLLLASFGSTVVFVATLAIRGDLHSQGVVDAIRGIVVFSAVALVSAFVLVLPVMVFVPPLRRPSPWIAAPWGAAVACFVATALAGGVLSWDTYGYFAFMGLSAGVVYAFSVRVRRQ
jgi:hypothetical protein